MKVKFDLPKLVSVEDYHEFSILEDRLSEITGKNINVLEIGCAYGVYYGCVYIGIKPSKRTIKFLLVKIDAELPKELEDN